MKARFQAVYAALLVCIALIDSGRAWSGPRARKGFLGGPPSLAGYGGAPTAMGGQLSSSQPGTVSNSQGVPQRHQLSAIPNVPGGSYYVYSQLETLGSLAAYTPPVSGMFMSMISVSGGAGPGALKIVYATPNTAAFGVSASTTGGPVGVYGCSKYESYPVSWLLNGTNIPVGTFASAGAYVFAILTCQTSPPVGNPDISAYRAIATYNAIASATTTGVTVTFDAQPGVIRGIMAWGINTVGNATVGDNSAYVTYSAGGAFVQEFPVQGTPGPSYIFPAQPIPAANTAAISIVTQTYTGTTTMSVLVLSFY
jgi:hypothetical protein